MIQKRDNRDSTPTDNLRSRLFNAQESSSPGTAAASARQSSALTTAAASGSASAGTPTIGATMTIKGDLAGKEDVIVRGKLEGSVILNDNDIVIDESGQVEGSIIAKHVMVKGGVNGEIQGLEKVTISATGRVQGTISAPRLVLEDGGRFKGMIDMPLDGKTTGKSQEPSPAAPKRAESAEAATTG